MMITSATVRVQCCNNSRSEIITNVRVSKNEVRIRNKKVVYKKKIRKMPRG
jgi:hypothetical protein